MKKTIMILTAALMSSSAAIAAQPTDEGFVAPVPTFLMAQAETTPAEEGTAEEGFGDESPDSQVLEDDTATTGTEAAPTAGDEELTKEGSAEEGFGDESPDAQVIEEGADSEAAGDAQMPPAGSTDEVLEEEGSADEGFGDEGAPEEESTAQ